MERSYMGTGTAYSVYGKPPQSYMGTVYNEKHPHSYVDSVYEEKKRLERRSHREAMCCEIIALVFGFVGLIGVSAVCGLPMWKVTAFIQENIITMETRWEG
ncbi:hypothetical protein DPEC_G00296880, partial [Dallia pectoralis]